jgi:hypothetical protein
MPTTSNFGWTTPADTDLVKDGALAIRTLGNGIDTSLVDLKGGTTGQVLSKNSNTDMDFTWVAQDDSNAIQNAIVDAKGDLISATAADTPARLAVGTNGQVLTADSTTATGLKWAAASASSGPAFRAYRTTSDQTISSANTWTKIQFNAETFDTDSCFDSSTNYRFTPNKAGYYEFKLNAYFPIPANYTQYGAIYKNGSVVARAGGGATVTSGSNTGWFMPVTDIIYMNGSTDYVEGFALATVGGYAIGAGTEFSYFTGIWIRS